MVKFCKPKGGEKTSHLFLGNCGPAVGISLEQIAGVLQQLGLPAASLEAPETLQGRVYASFGSQDQAAAVLEQAHALSSAFGGRQVVLKYAALEPEHGVSLDHQRAQRQHQAMLKLPSPCAQRITWDTRCSPKKPLWQKFAQTLQPPASRGCSSYQRL